MRPFIHEDGEEMQQTHSMRLQVCSGALQDCALPNLHKVHDFTRHENALLGAFI